MVSFVTPLTSFDLRGPGVNSRTSLGHRKASSLDEAPTTNFSKGSPSLTGWS